MNIFASSSDNSGPLQCSSAGCQHVQASPFFDLAEHGNEIEDEQMLEVPVCHSCRSKNAERCLEGLTADLTGCRSGRGLGRVTVSIGFHHERNSSTLIYECLKDASSSQRTSQFLEAVCLHAISSFMVYNLLEDLSCGQSLLQPWTDCTNPPNLAHFGQSMHFSDESVFATTEHDWSIPAVPSTRYRTWHGGAVAERHHAGSLRELRNQTAFEAAESNAFLFKEQYIQQFTRNLLGLSLPWAFTNTSTKLKTIEFLWYLAKCKAGSREKGQDWSRCSTWKLAIDPAWDYSGGVGPTQIVEGTQFCLQMDGAGNWHFYKIWSQKTAYSAWRDKIVIWLIFVDNTSMLNAHFVDVIRVDARLKRSPEEVSAKWHCHDTCSLCKPLWSSKLLIHIKGRRIKNFAGSHVMFCRSASLFGASSSIMWFSRGMAL